MDVEWYTPPEILHSLGPFCLDPCSPVERPWDTADKHYTIFDNGLMKPWEGRVWMNPPFGAGAGVERWAERMAYHGKGIALFPARTSSKWFQKWVFCHADCVLFLEGKIYFYRPGGVRSVNPLPIGIVLAAYGQADADILRNSGLPGVVVSL